MKISHWLLGSLLTAALAVGCATKEKMQGSALTPGAQGTVKASKASGGNTDLTVKVKHLAPPERVASGATDYIVWVQPEGSTSFQNVGALKVGKDEEGKYKTTIPFENFRLIVTPEPSRMMSQPTGPAVFDQTVKR